MATLNWLKTYLNITWSDQDAVLQIVLDGAIATVEQIIGKKLSASDYTVVYNWNAQQNIVIKETPINTFTNIERNDGTIETPVWTTLDINDYVVDLSVGIVYLKPRLQRWLHNYRLQYNAWYINVPADLNMAVYQLAGWMYSKRGSQGINSETVDGDRIDYWSAMTTEINNILFSYRDIF